MADPVAVWERLTAAGSTPIIASEQRGCGRSRPLAIDDLSSLEKTTTQALIADMEALHSHFGIDRWGPHRQSTHCSADPVRRQVFAMLVTHYRSHHCFLSDAEFIDRMSRLQHLPATFVQGKLDVSGPPDTAWNLHKSWPGSRFVLVDGEGHGGAAMIEAVIEATDRAR